MIGTFITTKYEDRAAYEAGREHERLVTHNRYTNVGLKWMWDMMSGSLRNPEGGLTDHLRNARILVGTSSQASDGTETRLLGDETDQAEMDEGYPGTAVQVLDEVSWGVLTIRCTFGERQGIFDWQERGVVTSAGVLLDRSVGDQGRKPVGAIWACEAQLQLSS